VKFPFHGKSSGRAFFALPGFSTHEFRPTINE
jgi:hypothetical protein